MYNKKYKESMRKASKKYASKHKEEKAEYDKKYREEHNTTIYQREYRRKRRAEDIEFRIKNNLGARVRCAIKNKQKRTLEFLGCSIPDLIKHLEGQFQEGMTWDNYGEWHIDHIRPCALFDLLNEEEQLKCFNYTNLQPLWAIDNLRKSDKWNEKA